MARRLANDALKPAGSGDEVEFESAGVPGIEPLYGDGVTLHGEKQGRGMKEGWSNGVE